MNRLARCVATVLFAGCAFSASAMPINDNAVDALWLTLNTTAVFDNTEATAEIGEVSPGAGTVGPAPSCNATDGWCSFETVVQSSVWYKFLGAFSPVTIDTNGVEVDLQFALWTVGDPANFATFTEVAANDDGGPVFAPLIGPIALNPGDTYYLQIDGFNTATASAGEVRVLADQPFVGVVPIPATLALLVLGLAGLGLSRRKKS